MEIKKIRKMGLVKIVTIPKKSDMQVGDFVLIENVTTLWKDFLAGKGSLKKLDGFDLKDFKKEKEGIEG